MVRPTIASLFVLIGSLMSLISVISLSSSSLYNKPTYFKSRKQILRLQAIQRDLIVGVNKYSHDTSCCFVDAKTGEVLLTQAKERLSRKKHDGGDISSIIETGLQSLHAQMDDIKLVVSNNHHFRIHSFEKRLSFSSAINYTPKSYLRRSNLLPQAKHLELSHHLAHAWSAVSTAPFSEGLIVVMDGMGESYRAMMEDILAVDATENDPIEGGGEERDGNSPQYMHDIRLIKSMNNNNNENNKFKNIPFMGQPRALYPGSGYREAETAYLYNRELGILQPVFKRWARERADPAVYNSGFEHLESAGAVYSRLSAHIFGDWNSCGKVMGLASWAHRKPEIAKDWFFPSNQRSQNNNCNQEQKEEELKKLEIGKKFFHPITFMEGLFKYIKYYLYENTSYFYFYITNYY
jgi:predicted NodU family carbamoyl transferase